MMTIFWILMYFVCGFMFAYLVKAYHSHIGKLSTNKYYAILGMLWLPYILLWVFLFAIISIYELFKAKL